MSNRILDNIAICISQKSNTFKNYYFDSQYWKNTTNINSNIRKIFDRNYMLNIVPNNIYNKNNSLIYDITYWYRPNKKEALKFFQESVYQGNFELVKFFERRYQFTKDDVLADNSMTLRCSNALGHKEIFDYLVSKHKIKFNDVKESCKNSDNNTKEICNNLQSKLE